MFVSNAELVSDVAGHYMQQVVAFLICVFNKNYS